jgi:hypothetical protein
MRKAKIWRSFSASHESSIWAAIISLSGFKVTPTLGLLALLLCYRFAFLLFGIMDRPNLAGEIKGSGEVGLFQPVWLSSTRCWKHVRRLVVSKCFVQAVLLELATIQFQGNWFRLRASLPRLHLSNRSRSIGFSLCG